MKWPLCSFYGHHILLVQFRTVPDALWLESSAPNSSQVGAHCEVGCVSHLALSFLTTLQRMLLVGQRWPLHRIANTQSTGRNHFSSVWTRRQTLSIILHYYVIPENVFNCKGGWGGTGRLLIGGTWYGLLWSDYGYVRSLRYNLLPPTMSELWRAPWGLKITAIWCVLQAKVFYCHTVADASVEKPGNLDIFLIVFFFFVS